MIAITSEIKGPTTTFCEPMNGYFHFETHRFKFYFYFWNHLKSGNICKWFALRYPPGRVARAGFIDLDILIFQKPHQGPPTLMGAPASTRISLLVRALDSWFGNASTSFQCGAESAFESRSSRVRHRSSMEKKFFHFSSFLGTQGLSFSSPWHSLICSGVQSSGFPFSRSSCWQRSLHTANLLLSISFELIASRIDR